MDKVRSVSVSMSSCLIYLNPEDFLDRKRGQGCDVVSNKKVQLLDVFELYP